MHKGALLSALLLTTTLLAGCIGGDDPGPQLGTYEIQASQGEGEHAEHGGGGPGLFQTAQLTHFNGSHVERFEYHEPPLGAVVEWQLSTGSVTLVLTDGNFERVLELTAEGEGNESTTIEGGHGTWKLNVTGQGATGTLSISMGDPAPLGLSQSEPLTYEDTLAGSTASQEHEWASTGTAILRLDANVVTGTFRVKVLDGMANAIDPISVTGPGQVQDTFELTGAPGYWIVTIQTETFTGQVSMTLSGA